MSIYACLARRKVESRSQGETRIQENKNEVHVADLS